MTHDGYVMRRAGGATAHVWEAAADWVVETLASGRTLHAWAADQADGESLGGRGTVFSVEAPVRGPDGRSRWAVRHYQRGGAIAGLLHDKYVRLGPTRPALETEASARARARGVSTPAVVAGVTYPAGLFYRADLVTELLPDAETLAEVLFSGPRDERARSALGLAGRLVRESAARGLVHPDLNAHNILVVPGSGGPEAHVIDLDRATVADVPDASKGPAMFERLQRSLRKLGRGSDRTLSKSEWAALRAAFEGKP